MATRAEICIPRILEHEGGYVDHPHDPGGATNKGITIATFRRYIKPTGTVADLKALTTAQATIVYKRQYWDKVSADLLPVGVDYAVADFAVNSGPARAARYLQAVVGVAQDGKIGPATIAAAKRKIPTEIITELCDDRMEFLRGLQTWRTFSKGWTNRVNGVRKDALSDALRQPVSAPKAPAHPDPAEKPVGGLAGLIRALLALFRR